jgi:hypothetical protein
MLSISGLDLKLKFWIYAKFPNNSPPPFLSYF